MTALADTIRAALGKVLEAAAPVVNLQARQFAETVPCPLPSCSARIGDPCRLYKGWNHWAHDARNVLATTSADLRAATGRGGK